MRDLTSSRARPTLREPFSGLESAALHSIGDTKSSFAVITNIRRGLNELRRYLPTLFIKDATFNINTRLAEVNMEVRDVKDMTASQDKDLESLLSSLQSQMGEGKIGFSKDLSNEGVYRIYANYLISFHTNNYNFNRDWVSSI